MLQLLISQDKKYTIYNLSSSLNKLNKMSLFVKYLLINKKEKTMVYYYNQHNFEHTDSDDQMLKHTYYKLLIYYNFKLINVILYY